MSTKDTESLPSSPEPLSFEEALTRLESTVQSLEQGGLTLEEATRLYEEGIDLSRICNQLLDKAELKITQLKTAYADYITESPTEYLGAQLPEVEE